MPLAPLTLEVLEPWCSPETELNGGGSLSNSLVRSESLSRFPHDIGSRDGGAVSEAVAVLLDVLSTPNADYEVDGTTGAKWLL